MLSKGNVLDEIENEIAGARYAQSLGNEGRARVCARRAAGKALAWFAAKFPRPAWGPDAMTMLKKCKDDPSFSADARDSAARLCERISADFIYPSGTDPVRDAIVIVDEVKRIMDVAAG